MNKITLSGFVKTEPTFSHECYGENFYIFSMETIRRSGIEDTLVCIAPETISSHLWWSMIIWEKNMYVCMCDWVTLLYSRKLTEHCKPAIMEKIKIIIKLKKK